MGHKAHSALLQSHMDDAAALRAMRETWDSFDILPNSHPLGADGREIPFDGWYEPGLGENIRLLCNLYDIAVVFCSYVFQSRLLEFVPDHILKVIDTHDKMGDRYEMLRRNGQPPEFFSCSPEQEGAYLRRADAVVARRAEEAEYFNSVSQRQTAIVIPHFEEPHFQERRFGALQNVGLVLDDEVALKYFRIQQMIQVSIDLSEGDTDPLKGPTDLGSGRAQRWGSWPRRPCGEAERTVWHQLHSCRPVVF